MWDFIQQNWQWVTHLPLSAILNIVGFMGVCMAYTIAYNRFKHRGRIILVIFTVVVVFVAITDALFPEVYLLGFLQLPLILSFNTLMIHGIMARYSVTILRFLEKFPLIAKLGILQNTSLFIIKVLCVALALPMTLWFATTILLVLYFAVQGFKQTRKKQEEEEDIASNSETP